MKILQKHKEIIMYLIFGVLTTLVNIVVYALFTRIINLNEYSSNIIAWVLSVLFAYFTNHKYVFESRAKIIKDKFNEVISFYTSRLLTFGVDMVLMFTMIDLIHVDDMASKMVVNIIVIVLNYLLSKFWVFKKNNQFK